jgi:hypothetical protein
MRAEDAMTTIQITLPDQLAEAAEREGLFSAESVEAMLRERKRARAFEALEDMHSRVAAAGIPYMSPEEIAEEVRTMRAERRGKPVE